MDPEDLPGAVPPPGSVDPTLIPTGCRRPTPSGTTTRTPVGPHRPRMRFLLTTTPMTRSFTTSLISIMVRGGLATEITLPGRITPDINHRGAMVRARVHFRCSRFRIKFPETDSDRLAGSRLRQDVVCFTVRRKQRCEGSGCSSSSVQRCLLRRGAGRIMGAVVQMAGVLRLGPMRRHRSPAMCRLLTIHR